MHKKVSLLAIEHPLERRALQITTIAIIALACAYLYLVTTSVLHVIAQREAMRHSTAIESSIATLEQRYFSLSQAITPDEANTLGLAPIDSTAYVYRTGNVGDAGTAPVRI